MHLIVIQVLRNVQGHVAIQSPMGYLLPKLKIDLKTLGSEDGCDSFEWNSDIQMMVNLTNMDQKQVAEILHAKCLSVKPNINWRITTGQF